MCILNEQFSRMNLLTSVKNFWKRNHFQRMHTISTNEGLIYFHLHSNGRHKASSFLGGGEGSGHAFLYVLRDLASHIHRPIQQYNIYKHPSVTICAAITKIPHVLYERSLLKTRK